MNEAQQNSPNQKKQKKFTFYAILQKQGKATEKNEENKTVKMIIEIGFETGKIRRGGAAVAQSGRKESHWEANISGGQKRTFKKMRMGRYFDETIRHNIRLK